MKFHWVKTLPRVADLPTARTYVTPGPLAHETMNVAVELYTGTISLLRVHLYAVLGVTRYVILLLLW